MIIIDRAIKPKSIKKAIGKNIKAARESSGISLEKLAKKMRKTPGYVGLAECGRRSFSVVQMIILADFLGVTVYELIQDTGTDNWLPLSKVIALMRRMTGAEISKIYVLCENLIKKG